MTDQQAAQKRQETAFKRDVCALFNPDPVKREKALSLIEEAWETKKPAFRLEELGHHPEGATIAAAQRDGHREVIEWLKQIISS